MKRSELYAAVWSQAPAHLAAQLGMSDTALRKLCRRHEVPVPPRGYWAKVGSAKPAEKTPLPMTEDDPEITLRSKPGDPLRRSPSRPQASQAAAQTSATSQGHGGTFSLEVCSGAIVVRSQWPRDASAESAAWVADLLRRLAA